MESGAGVLQRPRAPPPPRTHDPLKLASDPERGDLDARIHSLFGPNGAVLGALPGYRPFFLEETERSITG